MNYFNYTWIKLVNQPSYICTATCFEQVLTFKITWIERLKKRAISILGSNGLVYLQTTVINLDEPLEFTLQAKEDDYDCKLLLQFIPETTTKEDFLNWADNMMLTVYRITEE